MQLIKTKLEGVLVLEPKVYGDLRGFFMESYNKEEFEQVGLNHELVQDNHSLSTEAGTIRGLHYQLNPYAQTKIVRVLTGAIYDVVVDIRKGSPTYGEWLGVILTEENKRQLVVPRGFAHGFCTLTKNTQILYKVDQYYSAEHDRGIIWNSAELCIDWPFSNPVLSDKDEKHPTLKNAENNFTY
jgi:dTDP-4-dehydrorhamnose 3,5-epimerase